MYTRCPQCSTIFRVTASQLRTALGDVSCGSCHTTFNALNALTDDLPELTEVVVLDPIDTPCEPPADDELHNDESTEDAVLERFEIEDVDEDEATGGGVSIEEPQANLAAETDAAQDDDSLVDTFVDETADTELSGDSENEAGSSLYDTAEEPAGPAEPLYDDNSGCEEILTGESPPGMPANDESASDTWSRILASVTGDANSNDRRELEAEARTASEITAASSEELEPTYDDDTGYEETLNEEDFDTSHYEEALDEENFDTSQDSGDTLEFNAPEQTWGEIFGPSDSRRLPTIGPETPEEDADEDDQDDALDATQLSSLDSATADPNEWANFLSETTPATRETVAPEIPELTPVEDELQPDPLIDYDPEFVPPWDPEVAEHDSNEANKPLPSRRQIALAAGLIVTLGIQLIHYNRDLLASDPSWGQEIRNIYAALGKELYPDWKLDSYRISGSEAVAGRTAATALDIVANVVITGDEDVGMPMIRVSLRDRWANPVASRVFTPPEYLRDFDAWPALVSPGMKLPIEISVADPGADAQGYVVDVCLPRRTSGLQCQIDKDPFKP